jgi:hypothetical protein
MNDSNNTGELNPRQRKFIEGLARGLTAQQAARNAGFSISYSRKASRLLKIPAVAQALESIRSEARAEAVYGIREHVQELDRAILAAYASKAWMAVSRLLQSKGECYGFYVHRIQEVPIDLRGALEQARLRIININPPQTITQQGDGTEPDGPLPGLAQWQRDHQTQ